MTTQQFAMRIQEHGRGLPEAVSVVVKARRVNIVTTDDHAASAVNILAIRAGLKTLVTRTDGGAYVVGVTGFGRA